jgi:hypothetical protein
VSYDANTAHVILAQTFRFARLLASTEHDLHLRSALRVGLGHLFPDVCQPGIAWNARVDGSTDSSTGTSDLA